MSTSDTPQQDQEVEINYTITTSTGVVVDSTTNKASFCYILGTNKVHKEIDTAIASMRKNEKRKLILTEQTSKDVLALYGTASEAATDLVPLTCEIELVDFYPKIKSVFEMDTNEKTAISRKFKEEGVALFKEGKYVEAIEKFLKENHEVLITHPTVIEGHDVLFLDFYTSGGKEHITTYTIAL